MQQLVSHTKKIESTVTFNSELNSKNAMSDRPDQAIISDFLPNKSADTIDLEADAETLATT